MRFETLVDQVSKCQVLTNTIETILKTDRDVLLNLACPQWKDNLINHSLYQKYRDNQIAFMLPRPFQYIKLQQIKRSDDMFKVLVLGYFTLNKIEREDGKSTLFLNSKECPPLDEIGKLLALDTNCELSTNGKFYVDSCGYVSCRYCPEKAVEYNMHVDSKNPWWCVAKTKIFNGESVKSVFRHTIERDFQRSTFVGLLKIKISGRQFYGEHYNTIKLTGNIEHMILFKEQTLDPKCDLSNAFFSDKRIVTNGILEANPSHSTTDSSSTTNTVTATPTTTTIATTRATNHIGGMDHFNQNANQGENVQFQLVPSDMYDFTPTVLASSLNTTTNTTNKNTAAAAAAATIIDPHVTEESLVEEEETLDFVVDCIPRDYKRDQDDEDGHDFEVVDTKRFKLDN